MVTAELPRNVSLRQRTFHNGTRSPTFCTSAQKKGAFHEVVHRKCLLETSSVTLQIPCNNIFLSSCRNLWVLAVLQLRGQGLEERKCCSC